MTPTELTAYLTTLVAKRLPLSVMIWGARHWQVVALAGNPGAPPELLTALAQDRSAAVRTAAA